MDWCATYQKLIKCSSRLFYLDGIGFDRVKIKAEANSYR